MSELQVRYAAKTHVGRVRSVNEDSILALPDRRIWVVSDGMGGHAAGDFASQTVTEEVAMIAPDLDPRKTLEGLRTALARAHATIAEEAARRDGTIGATVVALVLTDGHFAAFWSGDSRLYRIRDGEIALLTSDHSLVAAFVESGQLSWDEAEAHPSSNEITAAVGVGEELHLDKVRGDALTGDRFLLCSDGLTKYATFETLRTATNGTPIETLGERLVQIALDGGGADNISVIVVDVI